MGDWTSSGGGGGWDDVPAGGGWDSPAPAAGPAGGGWDSPAPAAAPAASSWDAAPAAGSGGGFDSAPASGGFDSVPASGGFDSAPASSGFGGGDSGFGGGDSGFGGGDSGFGGGDSGFGGGDNTRPGDWTCPGCQANVFASKSACFKCGTANPNGGGGGRSSSRPGDWTCPGCQANVFASKFECFKCGTAKPDSGDGFGGGDSGFGGGDSGFGGGGEVREGDWTCPNEECGATGIFASKRACFKCGTENPNAEARPARAPRDDDWTCPNEECAALCFGNRNECFSCGTANPNPKPAREARDTDWTCPNEECGATCFGSKAECFLCGTANPNPVVSGRVAREDDWTCPGCQATNFGSRICCYKCDAERPEGMGQPVNGEPQFDEDGRQLVEKYVGEFTPAPVNEWGEEVERDLEYEKKLYDPALNTGIDFSRYAKIPVEVQGENPPAPCKTFDEMELSEVINNVIKYSEFKTPTPIQAYSVPAVKDGRDLLACAQTGSGKTAAFLFPVISTLMALGNPPYPEDATGRGWKAFPTSVIMAPTRELAIQIFNECKKFTYRSPLRPCVVYGGADIYRQMSDLQRGCNILVATPGRLNDICNRGRVSLKLCKYFILDEADRMLDMGFEPQLRNIIEGGDLMARPARRTMMFSATFPSEIQELATKYLDENFVRVFVGRVGSTTGNIEQLCLRVEQHEKDDQLCEQLNKPQSKNGRTLVFVQTKRNCDFIEGLLNKSGFSSRAIHGDKRQREREQALSDFRKGTIPILVATEVAARGLDIPEVTHVINYDMPTSIDDYVHRIGRTGRMGRTGLATAFLNDSNYNMFADLTTLLKESGNVVPDWLEAGGSGGGGAGYSSGGFGGGADVQMYEGASGGDGGFGAPAAGGFGGGDWNAGGGGGGW